MGPDGPTTRLTVNGAPAEVSPPLRTPVLLALRGPLAMKGKHFGCAAGNWGRLYLACRRGADTILYPSPDAAAGKTLVTVGGLGSRAEPGAIQCLFLDRPACGLN
jgi:nicotinate dehydrogenase subunit A